MQSNELTDNQLGSTAEPVHVGDWVWKTGLSWMRVGVDPFGRWQHVDWNRDEYAIEPAEERVIDDLVSNDVRIALMLDVWHPEVRVVFYKTEEDIAQYLGWARFMARHFKGRVEYYEILNEPDLNFAAPSGLPLESYLNLIKRTIPVIREEDSQAKIVVGGLPDTRFDQARAYMWGLLNSEVMPLVDGFSWHPMFGAAPASDPRGVRSAGTPQMANYWENYPALVKDIMSAGAAAGFRGEYLVQSMLWRTPSEPHESEPDGFTDVSGAKYQARAIIIHLGLDVLTGVAIILEQHGRPRSHSVVRTLSTVMAGAKPANLSVVIESAATNIKYYGFEVPNGDTLVALWTDGTALEHDPGIKGTVTLRGSSAQKVTGMDVLYGFEQRLNSSQRNGNAVIPGLLIRDYPLILSFTKP